MEAAGSNPAGDADSLGYANVVKRRSSNLRDFVGSTPTPSTARGDWALASPTGCNPAAFAVQVQLLLAALIRPVRLRVRSPVSQAGKRGSTPLRAAIRADTHGRREE